MNLTEGNITSTENQSGSGNLLQNELIALEDIIMTVGSSLNLDTVLERIVEITASTVKADDSFIYLIDKKNEEVVLAAATKSLAYAYKNRLRLKIGEGVTGYVASTQEPYLTKGDMRKDPHFIYTPSLGEQDYESMLGIPIISNKGNLIGVVSIYSTKVDHFRSEHINTAKRIALLVAGALENAKLYEAVNRRSNVLEKITKLSMKSSTNATLSDILEMITEITREILHSQLSLITIFSGAEPYGSIIKSSIKSFDATDDKMNLVKKKLIKIDNKVTNLELGKEYLQKELESEIYHFFDNEISAGIFIDNDYIGSIQSFSDLEALSEEDQSILQVIANHIGLVIKNKILEWKLEKINEIKVLFRDIESGNLTNTSLLSKLKKYNVDSKEPNVIIEGYIEVLDISKNKDEYSKELVAEEFTKRISNYYPKALFAYTDGEFSILVPGIDHFFIKNLKKEFRNIQKKYEEKYGYKITMGISEQINSLSDYPVAIKEAKESLKIGLNLYGHGNIYTLEDISYYLYLSKMSEGVKLREPYRVKINKLVQHDSDKDTLLLETLKYYLEYAGNIKRISERLYMHRNSIYKRLKRIEEIISIDLSNEELWFPMLLALKLRELKNNDD